MRQTPAATPIRSLALLRTAALSSSRSPSDSISAFFGSNTTVPGYGFILNDRGANFTLEEGHPNQVAPRKRPLITITAGFITKDGRPLMAFGNKGGTTSPRPRRST